MEKIGLLLKEIAQNRIEDSIQESGAIIVVKYSGLSSPDLTNLRQLLNKSNARLFLVKNSVACRALKKRGLEELMKTIEGPCGLIFVKDEPVGASRVLYNFAKEHEQLKFEKGYLKDKLILKEDIESMAKLPFKDALRAQVVIVLNAPIQGLVLALNRIIRKFVICLDRIKAKKEGEQKK